MSITEKQITDEQAEAVRALPFVSETQTDVSFWSAEECGHQGTDIDRGAFYAKLAVDLARACEMPELIAFVMRDMVRVGKFGALEAGFIGAIASAAKAGSMN